MTEIEITGDVIVGKDGVARCPWGAAPPIYAEYHDTEWGVPLHGEAELFERIMLEAFQSGLSWLTILRKRENFREAFHGFDFEFLAGRDDSDIERHLGNQGIIRHRGKIASVFNNARRAVELAEEHGSLARYFWSHEPQPGERPGRIDIGYVRGNTTTVVSVRISKDLKRRGWSFVGPTTVYAFMQAMGLVNDHIEGCVCRARVEVARERLKRP